MSLNLAVAWLLQQSGGTLFNLAQQYLSDRMGFGSLTKSHVRSLLEEYIQKLEAKINVVRQILAQFPKPPPGPLQQPKPTAFSPSPNTLSSQSSLPTNSPMGTVLLTCIGHRGKVNSVVWSPDGERIASASADKTIQVWDALTGQRPLIHRPVGVTYVSSSIKWSPSSDRIALGGFDVWGKGRVVIIKM